MGESMGAEQRCACSSNDCQQGRFALQGKPGFSDQLLFVASSAAANMVLAYVTVTNEGPRAVRIHWDARGVGARGAQNEPPLPTAGSLRGASPPDLDPGAPGAHARGGGEVDVCCPPAPAGTTGGTAVVDQPPAVVITAPKGG